MSFYLDLGTLLPKLNIFIFQGLLKLSEGEETIKYWWTQKLEYVEDEKCSYKPRTLFFLPKVYVRFTYISPHFSSWFFEEFLAQNKKNFSNALQSNPAALVMNAGQR